MATNSTNRRRMRQLESQINSIENELENLPPNFPQGLIQQREDELQRLEEELLALSGARASSTNNRNLEAEIERRAQEIVNRTLEQRSQDIRLKDNGKVFSTFEPANDIVENQKQIATGS